ncbi:hypothetical protein K7432_005167 [Basidiobolus ranarum]|uniref:NAD(P)-binding domain-containing protein n=1 Tax=Basidiobolus ranarum TaxID=34480 RepID=A0ABR2W3Q6_9FUNG
MARIVIVGGRGKVASRLATLLAKRGDTVHSIVRDPSHKGDIEKLGATPIVESIEDASIDDLAQIFSGNDAVIFSAGAGGKGGAERTKKVDLEGAKKVVDATKKAGVKRFLLVSANTARPKDDIPSHWDKQDVERFLKSWEALPDYYEAKIEADRYVLQQDDLDWTILRPGLLSDAPGTGKVSLGKTGLSTDITRDDVAAVLVALLDQPQSKHLALDLINGDTSINEAVKKAVEARYSALSL